MSLLSNHKTIVDLGKVNPAFAKHVLIKNDIVKLFALKRYGTIDLLDQPMCEKCEKPATWHTGGTAYHHECGTHTKHPITMLEYLRNEIKLSPEMLELFGNVIQDPNETVTPGGIIL